MNLSTDLRARMEAIGIDVDQSLTILNNLNAGAYDHVQPVRAEGIPDIDGTTVLDRRGASSLRVDTAVYRDRLRDLAPEIPAGRFGEDHEGMRVLSQDDLKTIGILLYPYLSYGVLNGGSATSYGDRKKNESFDSRLFELYRPHFDELASISRGRPKGLTPAYINPDGSHGASFLELKFRMLLLGAERCRTTAARLGISRPDGPTPLIPAFEMTSLATEEALRRSYASWTDSPYLSGLSGYREVLSTEYRVQPLISAFTHSSEGKPRGFFTDAYGKQGNPLGLPGGHGQNFSVLAPLYRELRAAGKRFVYLGNVDNLGFTVDPVSLAILALRKAPAAFEFVFRTPVDVKGGVLVYDQSGGLNCADIGPAIAKEDVFRYEEAGKKILFNCATGLFDLDYLAGNIDRIAADLPTRVSDQDKDAGRYSQAEQVTWEVISMLPDPLIFGVDKYRRFLAAKMLLETLLTSGLEIDRAVDIQPSARELHGGLERALRDEYGLDLRDGRWVPAESS